VITREEWRKYRDGALEILDKAGVVLTQEEKNGMEVADFGLGDVEHIGLQLAVYPQHIKFCLVIASQPPR